MSKYCKICGAECSGKLQTVTRKNGRAIMLCPFCFDKTMNLTATAINKMIRPRKKKKKKNR